MESLNLLRYLVIRDKVTENRVSCTTGVLIRSGKYHGTKISNSERRFDWYLRMSALSHGSVNSIHVPAAVFILQTGIWTELYKIEDTFIKPLRVGVNMSRAHYERELHNTMETKRGKAKGSSIEKYESTYFVLNLVSFSHTLFVTIGIIKLKSFLLQWCLTGTVLTAWMCFFTEESVLSVSVGDEKLPNMTSESQIEVSHCFIFTWPSSRTSLYVYAALTWLNLNVSFRLCTPPCTRLTWSRACWCE